jgi:hypothetical protein
MKKLTYLFLILLGLGISGCKKYLDLTPIDQQNSINFFQTPQQFKQAVTGAYAPLQGMFNGSFWAMAEMRSDNTSYEYDPYDRSGTDKEELDEFRELNNNDIVESFFDDSYTAIGRCNVILTSLSSSKNTLLVKGAAEDTVAGQASFLRAYYYFNLVRLFGTVPLVLTEVTTVSDAFKVAKKAPVADIYTSIIADAKDAIAKLPVNYPSSSDLGRATKGTAETMLADVYLTMHNYDAAVPLLQTVVASGAYSLNADYADNFDINKKNGPESIFEIQYIEGNNSLSSDFMDTFAPWDLYDNSATGFELLNGASNGWNIPTNDMVNAYEAGDKRRGASLVDYVSNEYGTPLPYIKKYQAKHSVIYQYGVDFPVYRYSDVLLMLSECLNEQAYGSGDAFHYLNMVRERAGLPDRTAGTTPTQAAFRTAIYHERQVELAFENHRWFDLLRTGTATDVMKAHAAHERALKSSYLNSAAYADIRLLYQYPLNEQLIEQEGGN